jgi:3-hydroxyisobutyrate dehydrogenase-like beta-hydroxyacid dehydrogenase
MKPPVGVIGLGIMGSAMAANLMRAGHPVIGYDVLATRRRAHRRAGGQAARACRDVGSHARLVICSLPSSQALRQTADELARSTPPPRIVIDTSTLPIAVKEAARRRLAAHGTTLLDCPLSGTGSQARTKDLIVYASGDSAAIKAMMPVFADFSRQAHDLGAFGNGMKMKFVANLLVAIHNVASAEAMVLGMKAGLDPAQVFKLVQAGAGNSRVFELRAPMMVEDRYDGDNLTMRVSTWQKDMKVIGEYAASVGCPTPLFSASEPIYRAALSTGHADEDTGSVCAVLEAMAGVKR